jgi:photosystem II stability/assembly factor-like uncharacterized protein
MVPSKSQFIPISCEPKGGIYRNISVLILFFIVDITLVFAQEGWFSVSAGFSYGHHAVHFVNADTGWVVQEGGNVIKTENGGNSWDTQSVNNNYHPEDLFFLNANIGWMSCDDMRIFKTVNGGQSWDLKYENTSDDYYVCPLYSIHFANENVGYTVGWRYHQSNYTYETVALKSENGGESWAPQIVGSQDFKIFSVYFADENKGWIVGKQGYVFSTVNGGSDWVPQDSKTSSDFFSVFFINENIGWAVGANGTIIVTQDGGNNWEIQTSPTNSSLWAVHFLNEDIGYACGFDGTILKTLEGGSDWFKQVSGTNEGLIDIFFVSPDTGYCTGWFGTILKTINGGVGTNSVDHRNINLEDFRLSQNYPNPFNPVTTIEFYTPQISPTHIILYNIYGQKIKTVFSGLSKIGKNTIQLNASNLTSGVYFYTIESGLQSQTKKCVLIK